MVAGDRIAGVLSRLKREDCSRTKHDREFSKWEILIGPSDWEDYSLGKEGAERYRVHNLPKSSGPGVYELGIAAIRTTLGREIERLDSDRIVAVYLGQADSVRIRLQHYGRSGSHLGSGLFEDILSRGYPIVFRWTSTQSKSEAVRTETRLLNTFDYAWNLTDNGARRPDDVVQRLEKISSPSTTTTRFADITQRLVPFGHRRVGIRIKSDDETKSDNILSRVFKFGRSQPRLVVVQDRIADDDDDDDSTAAICGAAVSGRDSCCRRPPAEGKKRCSEHKGVKIRQVAADHHDSCGFVSGDGSLCRTQPVPGNKRCVEHKGRRIAKEKLLYSPDLDQQSRDDQALQNGPTVTCGVILGDGLVCTEQPLVGRVRCGDHKGMRVDIFMSKSTPGKQIPVF